MLCIVSKDYTVYTWSAFLMHTPSLTWPTGRSKSGFTNAAIPYYISFTTPFHPFLFLPLLGRFVG